MIGKESGNTPGPRGMFSDAQWCWVMERLEEGYTSKELALFLGCEVSTVRHHTRGASRKIGQSPGPLALHCRRAEFDSLGVGP